MPLTVASSLSVTSVDWSGLDTILLDMDGTILDLAFDNHFWGTVIPREWGLKRGLDANTSQQTLAPVFANEQGKLNWYCLDFGATHWTLISRPSSSIRRRHPLATSGRNFFTATAGQSLDVVLITNAHPLTLEMKAERLPIAQWFDKMISSHDYGAPKETPAFWNALMGERPFNPERTLFMDDSEHVLIRRRHLVSQPGHAAAARLDSPVAQ